MMEGLFETIKQQSMTQTQVELEISNDRLPIGTHGDVFLGTYFRQKVAVKKLFVHTPDLKKYTTRELEIFKNTRHPNIIQCLYVQEKQEEVNIVTEYAERSLESILENSRWQLDMKHKLLLLKDIASAMYYIHSQGYIHRDLNTRNVAVTSEWTAKLCDFGIARTPPKDGDSGTFDNSATQWTAPEVLLQARTHTSASDVYSFGLMIYAMVKECAPPKRSSSNQFGLRIDYSTIEDASLRLLMQSCCLDAPEGRPTFKHILSTLEELCQQEEKDQEKNETEKRAETEHEVNKIDLAEPLKRALEVTVVPSLMKLEAEISAVKDLVEKNIVPVVKQGKQITEEENKQQQNNTNNNNNNNNNNNSNTQQQTKKLKLN